MENPAACPATAVDFFVFLKPQHPCMNKTRGRLVLYREIQTKRNMLQTKNSSITAEVE
jgi:hypothetical protein